MSDFAIFLLMFSGLATIAAGLAMVWPPLAVLFGGVLLCVVATSAYGQHAKRR
jgi:hypothetical protein